MFQGYACTGQLEMWPRKLEAAEATHLETLSNGQFPVTPYCARKKRPGPAGESPDFNGCEPIVSEPQRQGAAYKRPSCRG